MAATSEVIPVGELGIRFLVEGSESGGTAAVFEVIVPAGAKVPAPHSHDAYEETIYGVSGVSTWTIEGEPVAVAPGVAVCIPRGAVHRFDNFGDETATALCIVTPGILGPGFFRDMGALFAGGGPPEPARIGEVMRRHGLTIAAA